MNPSISQAQTYIIYRCLFHYKNKAFGSLTLLKKKKWDDHINFHLDPVNSDAGHFNNYALCIMQPIISQLPVSMEEIVDLLNDVNQQLVESGGTIDEEQDDEDGKGPAHSSPAHPTETSASVSHLKFSTPSPNKSIVSPSKRHLVCLCCLLFFFFFLFPFKQNIETGIFYIFLLFCSDFSKGTSLGGGPEKSPPDAVSASRSP